MDFCEFLKLTISKIGKRNSKREATIKYDTEDEDIKDLLIIIRTS